MYDPLDTTTKTKWRHFEWSLDHRQRRNAVDVSHIIQPKEHSTTYSCPSVRQLPYPNLKTSNRRTHCSTFGWTGDDNTIERRAAYGSLARLFALVGLLWLREPPLNCTKQPPKPGVQSNGGRWRVNGSGTGMPVYILHAVNSQWLLLLSPTSK